MSSNLKIGYGNRIKNNQRIKRLPSFPFFLTIRRIEFQCMFIFQNPLISRTELQILYSALEKNNSLKKIQYEFYYSLFYLISDPNTSFLPLHLRKLYVVVVNNLNEFTLSL